MGRTLLALLPLHLQGLEINYVIVSQNAQCWDSLVIFLYIIYLCFWIEETESDISVIQEIY